MLYLGPPSTPQPPFQIPQVPLDIGHMFVKEVQVCVGRGLCLGLSFSLLGQGFSKS